MTKDKKAAGYFDSVRNCPVYEGDVYYEEGLICPYFRVVKTAERGFVIHHVGSTETFDFSTEGQNLIRRQYIGNELDNPNIYEEFEVAKNSTVKENLTPEKEVVSETDTTVAENLDGSPEVEAETTACVEEKENTEKAAEAAIQTMQEAAEGLEKETTEEKSMLEEMQEVFASNDKTEEISNISETAETTPEECKIGENTIETTEKSAEKAGENELISELDDISATLQANTNEGSTSGNGTETEGDAEQPSNQPDTNTKEEGAVSAEATTGNSNVIVETAKSAVPEVIANTAEEKKALLRIQTIKRCISSNYDKIAELENTVDYHRDLASTLDYEPFVKLKDIVSEALHSNVDAENLKGLKDNTKNFESIINIQNLLKEHSKKADDAEYDISKLKNEIDNLEKEQAEIEEKIDKFARQTRLFD